MNGADPALRPPTPAPRFPGAAKAWLLAAGIVLAAVAVVVAMVALRPDPPPRDAAPQAPVVTTVAAEPGRGPIPVLGSGTVRPRAEIEVAAEVAGKVAWVNPAFQSGGRLREGDVLFRIDDADYRNRVSQARANVAAQQVALLQAEEEARLAVLEYERFRERVAGKGEGARLPASPLALQQPQLAAARAALARDSAVLAGAELSLARTEVRAPFDALVRAESVDEGRFVAVGQSVGRLYADDAYEVVVSLPDADAALLPGLWELEGQGGSRPQSRRAAEVVARHGSARYAWAGHVDRAEAALSERTRTVTVIVRVPRPFSPGRPVAGLEAAEPRAEVRPNAASPSTGAAPPAPGDRQAAANPPRSARVAGPPLLIGQFVDVRIEGLAPGRYWVVPRRALRSGDEVWALANDSTLTIVPVQVLQRSEERVWVAGRFPPRPRVVTAGISVATEGMRVSRADRAPAGGPSSR